MLVLYHLVELSSRSLYCSFTLTDVVQRNYIEYTDVNCQASVESISLGKQGVTVNGTGIGYIIPA